MRSKGAKVKKQLDRTPNYKFSIGQRVVVKDNVWEINPSGVIINRKRIKVNPQGRKNIPLFYKVQMDSNSNDLEQTIDRVISEYKLELEEA